MVIHLTNAYIKNLPIVLAMTISIKPYSNTVLPSPFVLSRAKARIAGHKGQKLEIS